MNGKTLLQSMTGIDEKFIHEANLTVVSISEKKRRKRIQTAVFVAVAALAMTTTAGALTGVFNHRETVESYLHGNSRKQLEEKGLVTNYVTENDYFRLTAETILNDGFQIYMIATLEPLEETAQEYLDTHDISYVDLPIIYTDTGERAEFSNGKLGFEMNYEENLLKFNSYIRVQDSRPMEFQFNMSRGNEKYQYMFENLSVPLKELPVLEQVRFQSEEGKTVILTPLELYSEEQSCLPDDNHQIYLVKQNGKKLKLGYGHGNGLEIDGGSKYAGTKSSPASYALFKEISDVAEIQSIEFYNANTNTSLIYKKAEEESFSENERG